LPKKNLILAPYKKNPALLSLKLSVLQPLVPFNVLKKYNLRQRSCCWHFRRNITALSRAITLVESTNSGLAKANEVINACLPHANQSVRIELQAFQAWVKVLLLKLLNLFN
jgi:hypothetical protein